MENLNAYIDRRYTHWLEYSKFQCIKNNIEEQSGDVLNYVLEDILTKKLEKATVMFGRKINHRKKSGKNSELKITELDAYIIQSIKFSCIYKSSSYQLRNRNIQRDSNIDLCKVSIPYTTEIDEKLSKEQKIEKIEKTLYKIDVSQTEINAFLFYLNGKDYREWEGLESKKKLSFMCQKVTKKLCEQININSNLHN